MAVRTQWSNPADSNVGEWDSAWDNLPMEKDDAPVPPPTEHVPNMVAKVLQSHGLNNVIKTEKARDSAATLNVREPKPIHSMLHSSRSNSDYRK